MTYHIEQSSIHFIKSHKLLILFIEYIYKLFKCFFTRVENKTLRIYRDQYLYIFIHKKYLIAHDFYGFVRNITNRNFLTLSIFIKNFLLNLEVFLKFFDLLCKITIFFPRLLKYYCIANNFTMRIYNFLFQN